MQEYQEKRGIQMHHMWGMTELAPIGSVAGLKVSSPCASPFDRPDGTGLCTCACVPSLLQSHCPHRLGSARSCS